MTERGSRQRGQHRAAAWEQRATVSAMDCVSQPPCALRPSRISISIRRRYGRALQLSSADFSMVSAGRRRPVCQLQVVQLLCRFATARSRTALRVCCGGPALLVDAATHAHGAKMVMTLATSGSSGARIPAELILTATGRVGTGRALAALGDDLVFRLYIR